MNLYVEGIGILSPAVQSFEELLRIAEGINYEMGTFPIAEPDLSTVFDFDIGVPAAKVRRAPRYAKMAVAAAAQAVSGMEHEPDQVGTVLSSGYGPIRSNVEFSDTVAEGNPALVSPTVFSYTVPNSCLGQVCIANGFRGPSTMLLAGDPLEYGAMLLTEGKADAMLCGAVEEAAGELRESFDVAQCFAGDRLADGVVMFLLTAKPSEHSYARIVQFSSTSLAAYPYVTRLDGHEEMQRSAGQIAEVLQDLIDVNPVDLVLVAQNESYFDIAERMALDSISERKGRCLCPKKIFGEALNAGYFENVALGAAILAAEKASAGRIQSLIATGIDVHGNYMACRMEV